MRREIGRDGVDTVLSRVEQHDLGGMIDVLDQGRDVGNVGLDEDHAFRRRRPRWCAEVAGGGIEPAKGSSGTCRVRAGKTVLRLRVPVCGSRVARGVGERVVREIRDGCRADRLGRRRSRRTVESDALLERNDGSR